MLPQVAVDFLKAHWRWPAAVLALIVAFAFGRFTNHPKVETHTEDRTVTVTDMKANETISALTTQNAELVAQLEQVKQQTEKLKRHTHRETTVARNADGSSLTKTVVDTKIDQQSDAQSETVATRTEKAQTQSMAVATSSQVTHEQTASTHIADTKVTSAPNWHLSALVGLDVPSALGGHLTPVFGADAQRRVIGPIWGGVWGLSSGVGGVSVGVEF